MCLRFGCLRRVCVTQPPSLSQAVTDTTFSAMSVTRLNVARSALRAATNPTLVDHRHNYPTAVLHSRPAVAAARAGSDLLCQQ